MDTNMTVPRRLLALPYNRERAVEYAVRWAMSRNPLFTDFAGVGGDCTNFVSQAVLAGSCQTNETPTFGWYFKSDDDRAPSWTGVDAFFDFMTGSGDFPEVLDRPGPFGYVTDMAYALPGDVVQLANREGKFYHTLLVTGRDSEGGILVTAHTNDALDRPLSSYPNASERFIHLIGVLSPEGAPPEDCFESLINGDASAIQ